MIGFLLHYWQWIVLGTISVLVLGYVAFLLKNWKPVAAVAILVALFFASQAMYAAGVNDQVAKEVREQTVTLQDRIRTYELLANEDKARADNDAATIMVLQEQLSKTPANTTPALPLAAAKRIMGVR